MEIEHCYRHTDRETGRHCTRCGKPACPDCLVQAPIGSHCLDCVKEQRAGSTQFAVKAKLAQPNLITKTLIGINLAVFVYGLTLRSVSGSGRLTSLDVDFALFAPNVANGEWYRIVTSGFLHSGFLHVAMNMYALWVLGAAIESMVGRVRFLGIYIVALFGGSAGALALDALQNTPRLTVGASGAIYGLFGALAVALHRSGRSIFASGGGRFQFGIGEILVLNLVLTLTVPGISIGGHLGGLVAGGALGWVLLSGKRATAQEIFATLAGVAACVAVAIAAAGSIG